MFSNSTRRSNNSGKWRTKRNSTRKLPNELALPEVRKSIEYYYFHFDKLSSINCFRSGASWNNSSHLTKTLLMFSRRLAKSFSTYSGDLSGTFGYSDTIRVSLGSSTFDGSLSDYFRVGITSFLGFFLSLSWASNYKKVANSYSFNIWHR